MVDSAAHVACRNSLRWSKAMQRCSGCGRLRIDYPRPHDILCPTPLSMIPKLEASDRYMGDVGSVALYLLENCKLPLAIIHPEEDGADEAE